MQRLHSTAARRAMAAAGCVFKALSGLCGGPRATSPGGRHSLAHQPGGNREGEAGAVPQKAQKEGCLGHSLLLVAKGIHPAAPRGSSPDPAPPLTEATPSNQRLPTARASGSHCTPTPTPADRPTCLGTLEPPGSTFRVLIAPFRWQGQLMRVSPGRPQILHRGKGTLWKHLLPPQIPTLSIGPPA